MRFQESWSSTSLANQAVLATAQDIFVLDSAFALIEGQPLSVTVVSAILDVLPSIYLGISLAVARIAS